MSPVSQDVWKSAQTGHLLLSTLHTNDAASSITRLVEMGVAPFMITSALGGGLAWAKKPPKPPPEPPGEPEIACRYEGGKGRNKGLWLSVYDLNGNRTNPDDQDHHQTHTGHCTHGHKRRFPRLVFDAGRGQDRATGARPGSPGSAVVRW